MHFLTSTEIDLHIARNCRFYIANAKQCNANPVTIVSPGGGVDTGYATPSVAEYIRGSADYVTSF
jgi:hypothetical protein